MAIDLGLYKRYNYVTICKYTYYAFTYIKMKAHFDTQNHFFADVPGIIIL